MRRKHLIVLACFIVTLCAVPVKRYNIATARKNGFEALVLNSLRLFWPGLVAQDLFALRQHAPEFRLWVLLDNSDDLPLRERREAWQDVQELGQHHRRNVGAARHVRQGYADQRRDDCELH